MRGLYILDISPLFYKYYFSVCALYFHFITSFQKVVFIFIFLWFVFCFVFLNPGSQSFFFCASKSFIVLWIHFLYHAKYNSGVHDYILNSLYIVVVCEFIFLHLDKYRSKIIFVYEYTVIVAHLFKGQFFPYSFLIAPIPTIYWLSVCMAISELTVLFHWLFLFFC